jgi:hypothetical protein
MFTTECGKQLMVHQTKSVEKMEIFETNQIIEIEETIRQTKFGILEGKIGTGKKLTVLNLIYRDNMKWDLQFQYFESKISVHSENLIIDNTKQRFLRYPHTLITTSCVKDWEKELANTTLKYITVTKRSHIQDIKDAEIDVSIILVSYGLYNTVTQYLSDIAWKRVVYDDDIKKYIRNMNSIICGFFWFLTSDFTESKHKLRPKPSQNYLSRIVNSQPSYEFYESLIVKHEINIENLMVTYVYPFHKVCFKYDGKQQIINGIPKSNRTINSCCPICYSHISEYIIHNNCLNTFCPDCLLTWLNEKETCPLCREKITIDSLDTNICSLTDKEVFYSKFDIVNHILSENKDKQAKFLFYIKPYTFKEDAELHRITRLYNTNFEIITNITKEYEDATDIIIFDETAHIDQELYKICNLNRKTQLIVHRIETFISVSRSISFHVNQEQFLIE